MEHEIDTHTPSGRPSEHHEQIPFQFNPNLANCDYVLPEKARAIADEKTVELQSDVITYMKMVNTIPSFFPNLLTGSDTMRRAAHEDAERALAEPLALIPFYSQIVTPLGEKSLPAPDLVSEEWAVYRWLQVQLLFALDVYVRYCGIVPQDRIRTYEKMEHDVLDAQVFMLGCLEGAFATHEKKLKRWWTLLCPSGSLYE